MRDRFLLSSAPGEKICQAGVGDSLWIYGCQEGISFACLASFNEAVGTARIPAREVADGVLVIFGGALLLTPGFITDVAGLLFLLPPTRALIRRVFLREAMRRITVSMTNVQVRRPPRRDDDIEGTAVDVDGRPPGLGA